MKNRRISTILLGSSLIVFTASAHAGDVIKANNTTVLNDAGSWLSGTPIPPDSTAVAVWNNTVTAANTVALGGSLSWQGIRIANPTGLVTINGSAGPATLTLGSAGIDMSAATQSLNFGTTTVPVLLSASQTWNIGTSRTLTFNANGGTTTIDLAGMTLVTSGSGNIIINNKNSLTSATAAIINVGNTNFSFESGGSTAVSISSNITTNVAAGKVFQLRGNSGSGSPSVGVNSNGLVNVNGGTFRIASSSGVAVNQTAKVSLATGSTLDNTVSVAGSQFNLSGELAVAGSTTWNESGANANTASTFSGALTGNGTLDFKNTSAVAGRRADWSGNNSAFTGTVNINGGSNNRNLRLTTATAGSASATWAPAAANILQVDGVAVNFGTLNGAGTVTNSHATNTAAISVGAGTFSGVISNGTPTDGMALTKTGVGTLALTGANSYTGLTDIQGGTLTTTTAETGGGAVTVGDTATLGLTQLSNGATFSATTLTMGSAGGSTLQLTPAAAPSAALVNAGTFTVNGPTTLRVTGLPVSGTTLVSYTSASGLGSLSLAMPFRINGTLDISSGTSVVLATVQDETPKWRNGDGVWDINTSGNWKTSATSTTTNYLEGGVGLTDTVIFDDTSSGTSPITVTLNSTVTPVAITVAGTKDYIISGSGTIAGTTGITKNGSAALTLATANTFSGSVLLNQGTLNINNATALGSGTLTIAGGTILNNTSGSAKVATNAQNWNGDFTFTGSNDLTLGAAAMNASRVVTTSNGTLTVGGISGTGFDLTKAGAGTLALSATSSYSGATLINAGVLKASAANAFSASSALTLANVSGAALDLNGFNQTVNSLSGGGATGGDILFNGGVLTTGTAAENTFAGDLVGAGGLTKQGAGRLILTGDKTGYTGTTNVNAGTLDLDAINGTFGPPVTVAFISGSNQANNSIVVGGGLFVQGNGTLNTGISGGSAGFGARGANLTVNVGGAGAMIDRNSGGAFGLGQMIFGSATSDSKVIVQNQVGLNNNGGTRDITVNPGTGTASAEIAGAIVPGTAGGKSGFVKKGAGELILSGTNTYTGDTKIDAGFVTLAATGQLTFVPTTNGTVNKITGVGSVTLNGAVSFNLAGANTTPGNVWKIVDDTPVTGLASNTIGATFSVVGFTESSDVWTRTQGGSLWTFTESSRTLTVQPAAGFAGWITGTFGGNTVPSGQQGPNDDPDNDGIANLVEYAILNGDPTRSTASPATISGNLVTFNKNTTATGISYALEKSETLLTWSPATPTTNDANVITYTLAPPTPSKEFVRLKVTQP